MDGRTDETNSDHSAPHELTTPRMGEDGKPAHDQEFFLSLARCGKDVWNQWRKTNPDIVVTFEGVNFNEPDNKDINFAYFELGDRANFRAGLFGNSANLSARPSGMRPISLARPSGITPISLG
jgi:hypothetical protein